MCVFLKRGISNNNKVAEFYLHPVSPDGSSEFSNSPGNQLKETVTLRKFTEVINNTVGDKTIDLMKINIEGGEFFAMPDIIESNKIKQTNRKEKQTQTKFKLLNNEDDENICYG